MSDFATERIYKSFNVAKLWGNSNTSYFNYILRSFGHRVLWEGNYENVEQFILDSIFDCTDEELSILLEVGQANSNEAHFGNVSINQDGILLFLSHSSKDKVLVSNVAERLTTVGIFTFVAHENIEIGNEWFSEIRKKLSSANGFVAFITESFVVSDWCDGEVGWAYSRGIPILGLNLGVDEYGFLGTLQQFPAFDQNEDKIYRAILDWLRNYFVANGKLETVLVEALCRNRDLSNTKQIISELENLRPVSTTNLDKIKRSYESNSAIHKYYPWDSHEKFIGFMDYLSKAV